MCSFAVSESLSNCIEKFIEIYRLWGWLILTCGLLLLLLQGFCLFLQFFKIKFIKLKKFKIDSILLLYDPWPREGYRTILVPPDTSFEIRACYAFPDSLVLTMESRLALRGSSCLSFLGAVITSIQHHSTLGYLL